MFFSILFAVLMSSFIAFGTKAPPPAEPTTTSAAMITKSGIAMKKIDQVGEELKYFQLLNKGLSSTKRNTANK